MVAQLAKKQRVFLYPEINRAPAAAQSGFAFAFARQNRTINPTKVFPRYPALPANFTPYTALCLRKRLEELLVPSEKPDAETRNLSKRFLSHKIHAVLQSQLVTQTLFG